MYLPDFLFITFKAGSKSDECWRDRYVNLFSSLFLLPYANIVLPHPTPQLEDIDVLVADHVQRVHKTNFLASWDEIGDECEMQDTYALTQMTSLEGKDILTALSLPRV